MNGVRDTSADTVRPVGPCALPHPVIPWPLGFSPLLFLGDFIYFLARRANRDSLS